MKALSTSLAVLSLLLATTAYGETKVDPTLRVIAEQRYDDDLLLRQAGNDGPLNGQFMTKLSPELGLRARAPLWTLRTWYAMDAMYRETSGTTRIDHRGSLQAMRQFDERTTYKLDFQIYRVTDPTSLPRVGVARTLSPVLYGKATTGLSYMAAERWQLHPYLVAEGAKVYDDQNRLPGYMLAPALESWFLASRRTSVGGEYRFQYLAMGDKGAHANGIFGAYRYRISRPWTFTTKAGPVFYQENGGGNSGLVPRLTVELQREQDMTEFGLAAGNDLVGASGFENALWAQFASVFGGIRVSEPLKFYGAGTFYRNGRAPGAGLLTLNPTTAAGQGYAGEVGVEWKFNRFVTVSGAFTRIAQVGTPGADLTRNIGAVRLILTNVE